MTINSAIAQGYGGPTALQTIGTLAQTGSAVQGFQSGQIDLQVKQQANQERQAVMNLFRNDPDFKPGPDGSFNQAAMQDKLRAVAPMTHDEYSQKISKTNSEVATANDAQLKMSQAQNQQVAQYLSEHVNDGKSGATKAIEEMTKLYPQTALRGQMMLHQISQIPDDEADGQAGVAAVIQHHAQATMTLAQRQTYNTQEYDTADTGDRVIGWGKKPGAPNAGSPTQPNFEIRKGLEPGRMVDAIGRVINYPPVVGWMGASGGGPQGGPPTSGGLPPPANPQPSPPPGQVSVGQWKSPVALSPSLRDQPGAVSQAQVEASNKVAQRRDAMQQQNRDIQPLQSNLDELYRIVDSGVDTGPGTEAYNRVLSIAGNVAGIGAEEAAKYQTAGALLDRIALQQAQAMGQTSVSGTQLTAGATGTTQEFNKLALKEKIRIIGSQFDLQQAYNRGYVLHVGPEANPNPENANKFDSAWSRALGRDGTDVARVVRDYQRGDTADIAALSRQTGKSIAYYQQRAKEFDNLTGGGLTGAHAPPGQ